MFSFSFRLILFFVLMIFISCRHDPLPDPCSQITVSYRNDIAPLILESCTFVGCHWPNAPIGNLADYDVLKEKIDSGLFNIMVIELKLMPPGDPLSDEDYFMLKCWLEAGAEEN